MRIHLTLLMTLMLTASGGTISAQVFCDGPATLTVLTGESHQRVGSRPAKDTRSAYSWYITPPGDPVPSTSPHRPPGSLLHARRARALECRFDDRLPTLRPARRTLVIRRLRHGSRRQRGRIHRFGEQSGRHRRRSPDPWFRFAVGNRSHSAGRVACRWSGSRIVQRRTTPVQFRET